MDTADLSGKDYNEVIDVLNQSGFVCVNKVQLMHRDIVESTICEIWEKDGQRIEVSPLHEYGKGECFTVTDADNDIILSAYQEYYEGQDVRLNLGVEKTM